ncbi:MAG: hypothetical protein AABY22_02025 [Nanoarchaeota archaeon]
MGKEIFERKDVVTEFRSESKASFIKDKGNSKTFRGYLNGCIKRAVKEENKEMVILLRELLIKFNEFYPNAIIKNEIEIIEGWKGLGSLEAFEGFDKDFIIAEHIKDKETGEVKKTTHSIPRENVNRLYFWIKTWRVGEKHKCYDFAPKLGYNNWKDLWRERKIYFAFYYYPIKILEALDIIKYSGRGDITRIK